MLGSLCDSIGDDILIHLEPKLRRQGTLEVQICEGVSVHIRIRRTKPLVGSRALKRVSGLQRGIRKSVDIVHDRKSLENAFTIVIKGGQLSVGMQIALFRSGEFCRSHGHEFVGDAVLCEHNLCRAHVGTEGGSIESVWHLYSFRYEARRGVACRSRGTFLRTAGLSNSAGGFCADHKAGRIIFQPAPRNVGGERFPNLVKKGFAGHVRQIVHSRANRCEVAHEDL